MDIRPIRTAADHRAALATIEALLGARQGSRDEERLEILSVLVSEWEAQHCPVPPADPIDAITFRMEQQGLRRRDLEPFIGPRQRVADVLNRRRPLTVEMIRRLSEGLGIPAASLVRPTPLEPYRKTNGQAPRTRPPGSRRG